MPDEEEGFTVRDRRRFLAEDPDPPSSSSVSDSSVSETHASPPTETEPFPPDAGTDEEEGELPDVHSVLAMFLGELRNLAWLRMGLVASPMSGKIERDLAQAKVAIDTVAFLASQLEPVVPPEERLPLRALVSDLQINFVEQSKK